MKKQRISNPSACLHQSPLVPHMAALLEFLGNDLMTDANPKVVLHAIETHETVIVQGGAEPWKLQGCNTKFTSFVN